MIYWKLNYSSSNKLLKCNERVMKFNVFLIKFYKKYIKFYKFSWKIQFYVYIKINFMYM